MKTISSMEPWTLFIKDGSNFCIKTLNGYASLKSLNHFVETNNMVGEESTIEEMASTLDIQKNEAQIIYNDAKNHFSNIFF